jgi:hypothetical protein
MSLIFDVPVWLKGLGHEKNIFRRPMKLNQYVLYMDIWLLYLYAALLKRKIKTKFLLASIKALTISKSGSESLIKFQFRIFFIGLFGRFLKYSESQAAFGTVLIPS